MKGEIKWGNQFIKEEPRTYNQNGEPNQQIAEQENAKKSLFNERENKRFSFWKSSMESICKNSNSHPSFTLYAMFMRRLQGLLVVLMLLAVCQLVYLST